MDHEHTHSHEEGHVHTHDHTHTHDHVHCQDGPMDKEKVLALLSYMLDHNAHHCGELKEVGQSLSGEAAHKLMHAVEAFDQANDYLAEAIKELKK